MARSNLVAVASLALFGALGCGSEAPKAKYSHLSVSAHDRALLIVNHDTGEFWVYDGGPNNELHLMVSGNLADAGKPTMKFERVGPTSGGSPTFRYVTTGRYVPSTGGYGGATGAAPRPAPTAAAAPRPGPTAAQRP
jgi:hypothetical protein